MKNLLLFLLITSIASATPPRVRQTIWSNNINGQGAPATQHLAVHTNDYVKFTGLDRYDNIVGIPFVDTGVDPCTLSDPYVHGSATEITGPHRTAIPGIFVRGPSGAGSDGPEIVELPTACLVDDSPLLAPDPETGPLQYCGNNNPAGKFLPEEMYAMPEWVGQLLIFDWAELETCDATADINDPCWDWDRLEHEFEAAADNGKYISMTVGTGQGSNPVDWVFTESASPGPAIAVHVEDNNSSSHNSGGSNCGTDWMAGSINDPGWRSEILDELIPALAAKIKSDAKWAQVLASFQLTGVHNVSDEFKLPVACEDDDHNGVLDIINLDECKCNLKAWAEAGVTSETILEWVEDQVTVVHEEFWEDLVIKYPLIQGGLPKVSNQKAPGAAYNWEGDTMFDTDGVTRLCPTCVSTDDNLITGSAQQVRDIDDFGAGLPLPNTLWVMHFGLGWYPTEDPTKPTITDNCSFGGLMNLEADPVAVHFPVPVPEGGRVDSEPGCPNPWANNTSLLEPRRTTGFQTNNLGDTSDPTSGGVNSPAAMDSVLWNLTRNTNAIYVEFYSSLFWQNHEINGSDGLMNVARTLEDPEDLYDDEIPYTKTISQWTSELIGRRENVEFTDDLADAFPSTYQIQMTEPGTYYYMNPRTCADGTGKWGSITVD